MFDEQIQIEEVSDKMYDFMADILADCSEEDLEEIFTWSKKHN